MAAVHLTDERVGTCRRPRDGEIALNSFDVQVRNSSVRLNAMTDIGDSGILVVGASGAHRTYQATNLNYPAYNTIEKNYIGNNGVWSKQTAAYYKSVARENYVLDNVFHDGPRSGVNYNDGAMGGEVMRGNMLLNYVKVRICQRHSSLCIHMQRTVGICHRHYVQQLI